MRRRTLVSIALAAGLCAAASSAWAGGFVLYEFGSAGTGMCGAATARGELPETLFLNPAAATRLEGTQAQVGVSLITPFSTYEPSGSLRSGKVFSVAFAPDGTKRDVPVSDGVEGADQEFQLFYPPHVFITHRLGEAISLGFAFHTPYGLGVNWPREWEGRYMIKEVSLQTLVFNPSVAVDLGALMDWKLGDHPVHFSLGVGYMGSHSKASIDRNIDFRGLAGYFGSAAPYPINEADLDGRVQMSGDAWANSFNAAVHLEVEDVASFGFQYRHGFSMDYEGDASFSLPSWLTPEEAAALGKAFPSDTTGAVSMNMPTLMNMGVAYLGIPNLVIEVDLYLEDWREYEELKFDWGCNDETPSCNIPEDPIAKDWEFNYQVNVGAQYTLSNGLALRAGYGHVGTPVPEETFDPMLPDGERNLFTVGAGMPIGEHFRADFGYMLAMWEGKKTDATRTETAEDGTEKEVPVNDLGTFDGTSENGRAIGTYTTMSHIFALTVGAKF